MADYASFPDDISALWGAQPEGLTPAPPAANGGEPQPAPVANGHGTANGHSSGIRATVVDQQIREDVTRLAEAIASNQVDVVRRSDLDAVRSDLTHQFAVALYELMAASNARFATAEDHISQRVTEALEAETNRVLASVEQQRLATGETLRALEARVEELRQGVVGPLDGLTSFQRELRHDVGRLSDLVESGEARSAERAQADTQRNERSDDHMVKAAAELGAVSEALAAMRSDLTAVREELAELREKVEADQSRARKIGWWGRNK